MSDSRSVDPKWWQEKDLIRNGLDRYIPTLEREVQEALFSNPSEALLSKIADYFQTEPRVVRRFIACRRNENKYYHFIYHKPRGLPCQPHQRGREVEPHVQSSLPPGFPAVPFAGRLDADTEGMLFFSDNGKLLNAMVNPTILDHIKKAYYVEVELQTHSMNLAVETESVMVERAILNMRHPIEILGSMTSPAEVELCEYPPFELFGDVKFAPQEKQLNSIIFWLVVKIREGKNRQIRRLCKRSSLRVRRLIRYSFGPLELGTLGEGQARCLTNEEVQACYEIARFIPPYPECIHCPIEEKGDDILELIFPPPPPPSPLPKREDRRRDEDMMPMRKSVNDRRDEDAKAETKMTTRRGRKPATHLSSTDLAFTG